MGEELILKFLLLAALGLIAVAALDGMVPISDRNREMRQAVRGFIWTLLPVVLIVLILRAFVVEPFRIPSSSMEPGLVAGDYILVSKYRYGLRLPLTNLYLYDNEDPRRGDVTVFFPPGDNRYFIKRVIGLPGDVIRYRNKQLWINGIKADYQPLSEDVLSPESRARGFGANLEGIDSRNHQVQMHGQALADDFEIRVSSGHYFVMGDNRDNSRDSRVWGEVPRNRFVGPAVMVWMHWLGIGSLPSFSRNGVVR